MKDLWTHPRIALGAKGMRLELSTRVTPWRVWARRAESPKELREMPLEERQQANEANFLDRVRAAYPDDTALRDGTKKFKRRLVSQDGLLWRRTEGREDAMYIPENPEMH